MWWLRRTLDKSGGRSKWCGEFDRRTLKVSLYQKSRSEYSLVSSFLGGLATCRASEANFEDIGGYDESQNCWKRLYIIVLQVRACNRMTAARLDSAFQSLQYKTTELAWPQRQAMATNARVERYEQTIV
jgi:hypothetical protein